MFTDYTKISELERLLRRELYKRDFYEFVKAFWETCDPAPFIDGKLIQFYCEAFQYLCRNWVNQKYEEPDIKLPYKTEDINIIDVRDNKKNVCINLPPRHSKSIIFSILGSTWLWTNCPVQAATVCHTESLATRMNTMRQKIVNSDKFKFFFPEIVLESNSANMVRDTRGGELYAINRNALLGRGVSIICNDDITNADTARRDAKEMESAWAYYTQTMPSRINDPHKYLILNIQQRLAPNDITGRLMSDPVLASQYTFVVLPAIFEKKTLLVCPMSGTVFEYEPGDYLWPERFGDYSGLRAQVGENIFQAQYMQKPQQSDRTVVKESMIIEKNECDVPSIDQADMIYASHDFPVKDKETSDFLGSCLAYRIGTTLYVIDCLEKRMAFVKSVEYVKDLDNIFSGIIQIVEDKANGSTIIQQLRDSVAGIQPFQPGTQSKTERLESASLYMNSGNVVFVRSVKNPVTFEYSLSEDLKNLKERLLAFPFVGHDDIVDAFSQLVLFVFMDRRYSVYGRSFNEYNLLSNNKVELPKYNTIFFNKDGDIWKVLEIGVIYGAENKLVVTRETLFKASLSEALSKMKEFAPDKNVFIDCSATEALTGIFTNGVIIERYEESDFDLSVSKLNVGFATKKILVDDNCKLTRADIDNFKYDKTKDDTAKFKTTKDGYVSCIRIAMKYYGGM